MATLGGGHRPSPRARAKWRRHTPRHALCRSSLRRFRFHALAPRSRSLFPHRALLKKIDRAAHGSPASILSVALERTRLFHRPPDASPRGRRLCPRVGSQARPHARAAGPSPRRPACQVRHTMGPARRSLLRLRKSRLAATRRFHPQREKCVTPDLQSRPRLRSEEHTSELQSLAYLVCRLLLEKKKKKNMKEHDKKQNNTKKKTT